MKFCPVVPEICRGQVHGARKKWRRRRRMIIIIIKRKIIIRNGAKTIRLNYSQTCIKRSPLVQKRGLLRQVTS
jgi:hypothetical protein